MLEHNAREDIFRALQGREEDIGAHLLPHREDIQGFQLYLQEHRFSRHEGTLRISETGVGHVNSYPCFAGQQVTLFLGGADDWRYARCASSLA